MLPNYQARSPFVLKHTTSMYVCVYGWYVCPLNARAGNFFLKFGTTKVTTAQENEVRK